MGASGCTNGSEIIVITLFLENCTPPTIVKKRGCDDSRSYQLALIIFVCTSICVFLLISLYVLFFLHIFVMLHLAAAFNVDLEEAHLCFITKQIFFCAYSFASFFSRNVLQCDSLLQVLTLSFTMILQSLINPPLPRNVALAKIPKLSVCM